MNVLFDNPNFKKWFKGSKVVDKDGNPKRMYHGTARPERIGSKFLPSRATSGPMAFFTDDPNIASKYAEGKMDTSVQRDVPYEEWFKVKIKGVRNPVNIVRAYWFLDSETRNKVKNTLPHVVNLDEGGYKIDINDCGLMGCAGWQYELKRAGGNVLKAAVEVWLNSGGLFNNEEDFLKILKLAGLDNVIYDNPHARFAGVIPVYLSIQNPLNTANISEEVIKRLTNVAKLKRGSKLKYRSDLWDKRDISGKDWIERLENDIKQGTTHVWTSIPDWITKELKAMGYDGIQDTGGKFHEHSHQVWIPFYPTQIKSIYNKGTFSSTNPNINESTEKSNMQSHREKIENSSEFKKWFGNSIARERMVSSKEKFQNKKPLVLYHGTNFDFSKFETGRDAYYANVFGSFLTKRHAIFLSESPEMASEFGKSVIPVYIKAETPLDLTTGLDVEDEQKLEKSGFNTRIFYYINNIWELFDDESGKHFVDGLKKAGYDSVVFNENIPLKGDADRGVATGKETTTWAVFEPTQIKSIYNKGTFEVNNPNINENYFNGLYNQILLEMPYLFNLPQSNTGNFDLEFENFNSEKEIKKVITDLLNNKHTTDKYGNIITINDKKDKLNIINNMMNSDMFLMMLARRLDLKGKNSARDWFIKLIKSLRL